jgi:beta-glucosidase
VCRDPRWGRTGETYGEDPFLCGILGAAVLKGYQGSHDGTVMPGHVVATLKHFTGHGQSEGGINQAPVSCQPSAKNNQPLLFAVMQTGLD